MSPFSKEFCQSLARARRARSMTQSALATAVGCKQSAISMLEAGQSTKVADETIVKIAALLDVALPQESAASDQPRTEISRGPVTARRPFCPNALCHSNVPYLSGDTLLFWPQSHADTLHCTLCGELLERNCPHCGAVPVEPGGCCAACGGALVTNTLPPESDPGAWLAQRRAEIAALRGLT